MSTIATPSDSRETPHAKEAASLLSDPQFNKTVTLPATDSRQELTISFADYGHVDTEDLPSSAGQGTHQEASTSNASPEYDGGHSTDAEVPTLLFMPGMFASRFIGFHMHAVAKKAGVRVLVPDRFGMGKTPDVPLEKRIDTWVEILPLLLRRLRVKHVALISHSAGTMYCLNSLWHCRDILDPRRPRIILLAPFIDPAKSKKTSVQAAQYIPTPLFSAWNSIAKFSVERIGTALEASGSLVTQLQDALMPGAPDRPSSYNRENALRVQDKYGVELKVQQELDDLLPRAIFRENTSGANAEAMLCLRLGASGGRSWGVAEDYQVLVERVAARERERSTAHGVSVEDMSDTHTDTRLGVAVYFAETDSMSGVRGQQYMEECWKRSELEDAIGFRSTTVKGSDHDTVVRDVHVLEEVMFDVGGSNLVE